MLDIKFKFSSEFFNKTLNGHGSGVTQSTNRIAHDSGCYSLKPLQISFDPLPFYDASNNPVNPVGPFTARCALSAGLVTVETCQDLKQAYHTDPLSNHDHTTGTEHTSRLCH